MSKRIPTKTRTNFWIDVAIFACFVGVLFTGCALIGDHPASARVEQLQNVHGWFGIIIAALSLVHFVRHWRWWINAMRRFKRLNQPARANFVIDCTLLVSFVLVTITGFFLWAGEKNHFFLALHVTAAISILITVIRHIAKHWKWITSTTRRIRSQQTGARQWAEIASVEEALAAAQHDMAANEN